MTNEVSFETQAEQLNRSRSMTIHFCCIKKKSPVIVLKAMTHTMNLNKFSSKKRQSSNMKWSGGGSGIEFGQHKLKQYLNIKDAISLLSSPRGRHSRNGWFQLQHFC